MTNQVMDKVLPTSTFDPPSRSTHRPIECKARRVTNLKLLLATILAVLLFQWLTHLSLPREQLSPIPVNAAQILDQCHSLSINPGPPPDFDQRAQSDRFLPGTKPTLIKNATIWTGRVEGLEEIIGDILLESGIIKGVGVIEPSLLAPYHNLVTIEANGAWVSPGIVDLHSHIGVGSSPSFQGATDTNSRKGPILPWLRALDALNTHNDAYQLSIAGGVTTALVLPGSANAIGGQGVVIKLRPTPERAPTAMLLENPYSTNETEYNPGVAFRWKQIKHACGENPDRVYSGTRMDTIWAFRQAYDKARSIKNAQDAFCAKAIPGKWHGLGEFPEDYQWEILVDVLRGRVKVHTHCYETVDLDDLVRITNEFQFPIAAFHHAHETYLVPDTLKAAYGHPPAAAMFATNARYKRESYRGSEFAAKILADNGIQVVMKSDHPVLDSRFLLYEAQQAHYYGLPHNVALAAVTTTPAQVLGQDHRIGFIKNGYDADIVLWDSHPLALGATPKQVWIDGIPQITNPHVSSKPASSQNAPQTPDFESEAEEALKYDGLPPLLPNHSKTDLVVFTNWAKVILHSQIDDTTFVNLYGGSISPGLISFGSPLALEEIKSEVSTTDGIVADPLTGEVPQILGEDALIKAVDGLQYATRNALLAYRSGVTIGVTAPKTTGFLAGLSTVFSTGTEHKLKKGALIQEVAALHVALHRSLRSPSISSQVAALRHILLGHVEGELGRYITQVLKGHIPLVIEVQDMDVMASIIRLKHELETTLNATLNITFFGASEAHLLAEEIAGAGIGVIVSSSRPYPFVWESRRILAGPPLSEESSIYTLLAHNVTVGIGVRESWMARNTRFDVGWAALEAGGKISRERALGLASVNLEKLLGIHPTEYLQNDLVAVRSGDLLDFSGKVVAVISPRRGLVDLL